MLCVKLSTVYALSVCLAVTAGTVGALDGVLETCIVNHLVRQGV